jgi:hypothetical protein
LREEALRERYSSNCVEEEFSEVERTGLCPVFTQPWRAPRFLSLLSV